MNCLTLQDIVRFGAMILMAIHVLSLVTEGATTNLDNLIVRDYKSAPKPDRSNPTREIRRFKPHTMSTAIGFGKRQDNYHQFSKLNQNKEMMLSITDGSQRFSMEWFVQFLTMNPGLARKVERNLFSNDENVKSSITQRYKKDKKDQAYYYDY